MLGHSPPLEWTKQLPARPFDKRHFQISEKLKMDDYAAECRSILFLQISEVMNVGDCATECRGI